MINDNIYPIKYSQQLQLDGLGWTGCWVSWAPCGWGALISSLSNFFFKF